MFSTAIFSAVLTQQLLSVASPLSATARARIRHAAAPLAHLLFTTYYVPAPSALTDTETQLLYCHRLGIALPFIAPPLRRHCYHTCPHYPPSRPIPAAHYFTEFIGHLYHHMACGAGGFRHRRHDALVRLVANLARQLISADVDTSSRLCSSSSKGTKVDIVVRTLDRPPYAMAIDVTVSCPLVPSHIASAATSVDALFTARAAEKNGKHLAGCVQLGRAFLPIVFTTLLGIGPRDAREYLSSLFSDLYVADRLAGGSGHDANHRRVLFLMSLQAAVVRANTRMVIVLSAPPPPAATTVPTAAPPPAAPT